MRAAVKGGYTAVNLMANTNPVCSDMETVRYIRRKAEAMGLVDVHQCVSVTKNFDGQTVDHLKELDGTVKLLSEDGKGVMSNHVMAQAMKIAKEKGMTVLSHAEDMEISPYDYRAGGEHRHRTAYSPGKISGCTASYVPCFHRGMQWAR